METKSKVIIAILIIICLLVLCVILVCYGDLDFLFEKKTLTSQSLADKLKFLGWIVGGIFVLSGLVLSYYRTSTMDKSLQNAQNSLKETELNNILELLSSERTSSQLMGFHALVEFKTNTTTDFENKKIAGYINSYIYLESNTEYSTNDTDKKYKDKRKHDKIQMAINALFYDISDDVSEDEVIKRNKYLKFANCNLYEMEIKEKNLTGVNFEKANLRMIELENSIVKDMKIKEAYFEIYTYPKSRFHSLQPWDECYMAEYLENILKLFTNTQLHEVYIYQKITDGSDYTGSDSLIPVREPESYLEDRNLKYKHYSIPDVYYRINNIIDPSLVI